MSENKVNNLLGVSMDKIKEMVDVNTVIGDPITAPDGTTVIPVSRVSYGFAGGGSDLPSKAQPEKGLFAGGSGAGITIQPIAFLVISNGNVRILQIEPYVSSVDRVVASVPDVVDKIAGLFNKDKKDKEDEGISLPVSAETAESVSVSAYAAVLYEPVSGTVLFEKNSREVLPVASTTKIMTALLAFESEHRGDPVTITPEMISVEGSSMGLRAGEVLALGDIARGMMMASGNDGANAIALYLSDSAEAFSEKMNARAADAFRHALGA